MATNTVSLPSSSQTASLLTSDSKNSKKVLCPICKSIVLAISAGKFEEFEKELPKMTQKATGDTEFEKLGHFWMVKDQFDFENVGYTHAVNGVKYLTCADCEIGPIGFQDPETKMNFVALDRVLHSE